MENAMTFTKIIIPRLAQTCQPFLLFKYFYYP
nr:MAG TPA: hypothetical protein [Caudoviricetes sp.]